MSRLRVGIVVPGFVEERGEPGMAAVIDLVERLAVEHDVWILALRHPPRQAPYPLAGAEVRTLGMGRRSGASGRAAVLTHGIAAIVGAHRRQRFDVLHGLWADEAGAVATLCGKLIGRPTVASVMGGELLGLADIGYGAALGRGGRATTRIALRLADVVTAGSSVALGQAKSMRSQRPLALLPLGVDLDRFRPPAVAPDAVPPARPPGTMLFVGSLEPVKDPQTAVRVFAQLAAERPGLRLEVVGDGSLRPALEALAAALGVADRVRFAGHVPRQAMPDVYRSAGVLLVTSRHEGQSMVAVEAAACGLPVVGTRVGVLPDLGGGAIAVGVGDDSALAAALAAVVDDPMRAEAMGAAARAVAVADYDLRATSAAVGDLYRSLSRRRSA